MTTQARQTRGHRILTALVVVSWATVLVGVGLFSYRYAAIRGLVPGPDVEPVAVGGVIASITIVFLGTRIGAYVLGPGSLPPALLRHISQPDYLPGPWRLVDLLASHGPGRNRSIMAALVAGWFTGLVLGLAYGAMLGAVMADNLESGQQRAVAWSTLIFAGIWVAFATYRMLRQPDDAGE